MNPDIKELIDRIDESNQDRSELEQKIKFQQEEINRLRFTIREQKRLIEEQENQIKKSDNIPEDIEILKDMVLSQRQELIKKDNLLTELKEKSTPEEFNKENFKELQDDIRKLKRNHQRILEEKNSKIISLTSQIENYKTMLDYLETEKETQNSEDYDLISERLADANTENNQLNSEIIDLKSQTDYFQNEIEQLFKKNKNLVLKVKEFKNLINDKNDEISTYQGLFQELKENNRTQLKELKEEYEKKTRNQIKNLNEKIHELESANSNLNDILNQNRFTKQVSRDLNLDNLPQYYQQFLIERMFYLMSDHNKQNITRSIIQDLTHKNKEIRRFAVKILSNIQTTIVFDSLVELINDEDWLVRYYLIKALSNFNDYEGIESIMRKFLTDPDVDVRELAKKYFERNV